MKELREILQEAGFVDIVIKEKENSDEIIRGWNFGEGVGKMVFSSYIQATKPSDSLTDVFGKEKSRDLKTM